MQNGTRLISLRFYTADQAEADMLVSSAHKSGFAGACYVDFPHKGLANKYFLCLTKAQRTAEQPLYADNTVQHAVCAQGIPQQPFQTCACPLSFPLQCKLLCYSMLTNKSVACVCIITHMLHAGKR